MDPGAFGKDEISFSPLTITTHNHCLGTTDLTRRFRPGDKVDVTIDREYLDVCPAELRGGFGWDDGQIILEAERLKILPELTVTDVGVQEDGAESEWKLDEGYGTIFRVG